MAVLARFLDLLTDLENLRRVPGVGRFQRLQASLVQRLRAGSPSGDILQDERFHLGRFQLYARRFRLLARSGHVTAGHNQEVRDFQQLDRAVPDLGPVLIRFRYGLHGPGSAHDRCHRQPDVVRGRIHDRLHQVFDRRRRRILRQLAGRHIRLTATARHYPDRDNQDHGGPYYASIHSMHDEPLRQNTCSSVTDRLYGAMRRHERAGRSAD